MICDPCRVAADTGTPHDACRDLLPMPLGSQPRTNGSHRIALVPVYRNWCDCQHHPRSGVAA